MKDEKTCAAMREYYQRIWDSGYSDLAKVQREINRLKPKALPFLEACCRYLNRC